MNLDPDSIVTSVLQKNLGPGYDFLPQKPPIDISNPLQLERAMHSYVVRSGKGFFAHKELSGREYTREQLDLTIDVVLAAEKMVLLEQEDLPPEVTPAREVMLRYIIGNKLFAEAAWKCDYATEMRLALQELDIDMRTKELKRISSTLDPALLRQCALEDIELAQEIARSYAEQVKDPKSAEVAIGIKLLERHLRIEATPDTTNFPVALQMLDTVRWIVARLEKDPKKDMKRAFDHYDEARYVLRKYGEHKDSITDALDMRSFIVRRMERLLQSMGMLDAASRTAYDILVVKHQMNQLSEEDPTVSFEDLERKAVENVEEGYFLAEAYSQSIDEIRSGSEGVDPRFLRMRQIVDDQKLDTLTAALQVFREERMEETAKMRQKPRKLVLPTLFPHHPSDEILEGLLPKGEDTHIRRIRAISRSLNHFVRPRTPYKDIPIVYKKAAAALRDDYSHEGLIRLASELVDYEEKGHLPDTMYMRQLEPMDSAEYAGVLAGLKPEHAKFLKYHFGNDVPADAALQNALIMMKEPNALLNNDVLGAWEADREEIVIKGYYNRESLVIVAFEDNEMPDTHLADTEVFTFRMMRSDGRISLESGWDNPAITDLDGMQVAEPVTQIQLAQDDDISITMEVTGELPPALAESTEEVAVPIVLDESMEIHEKPRLLFPLPDIKTDKELEDALENSFPLEVDGKRSRRNEQVQRLARLLVLYVKLNSPQHAQDFENVPELQDKGGRDAINLGRRPPELYKEAYDRLMEDSSLENVIIETVKLVNEYGDPMPPLIGMDEEVTQPSVRMPPALIFKNLTQIQKNLVAAAVFRTACTEGDMQRFVEMDPGVRDLRIRNFIAARWAGGDFRFVSDYNEGKDHLYGMCGLKEPTAAERLAAIKVPQNLTEYQRQAVASVFLIEPKDVSETHIMGFGLWVLGMEEQLKTHWEQHILSEFRIIRLEQAMAMKKTHYSSDELMLLKLILDRNPGPVTAEDALAVAEFRKSLMNDKYFWVSEDAEPERYNILNRYRRFWFNTPHAERLNYWRGYDSDILTLIDLSCKMRYDEGSPFSYQDLSLMAAASGKDVSQLTTEDVEAVHKAIIGKYGAIKEFHPLLFPLYHMGESMDKAGLLQAARKCQEFNILAGSLGVPLKEVSAVLDVLDGKGVEFRTAHGIAKPRSIKNWIDTDEGRKAYFEGYDYKNDDCFTGGLIRLPDGREMRMNAVFDGMGGHDTGYVASRLAKDVFDIFALAGWIRTPEDVRRAIITSDMLITFGQIKAKKKNDYVQENSMGTTATVTLTVDDKFYGIHTGDSLYLLIRDGESLTVENGLGKQIPLCVPHDLARPARLMGEQIDEIDFQKNVVTAALGTASVSVDIVEHDLKEGDVVMVSSDGITDSLLESEIARAVAHCGGELEHAREKIMAMAETRPPIITQYPIDLKPGMTTNLINGISVVFQGYEQIDGTDKYAVRTIVSGAKDPMRVLPGRDESAVIYVGNVPYRVSIINKKTVYANVEETYELIVDGVVTRVWGKNDDKTLVLEQARCRGR